MKRFFKIAGIILAVIFVLIAVFAAYVQYTGIPKYEPHIVEMKVDVTPTRVENGKRISVMLCIQCHSDDKNKLTGKFLGELPGEFGKIYSKNITHDSVKGIGKWTDGELYYFLRTGVRADGQYVPPYMPKFPLMADEEIKDVIAWLRSDSFGLEASKEEAPETEPSFLVKILSNTIFKPMPYPEKPIVRPDTTDLVALGKYYADGVASCFQCHSKDFKTVDYLSPQLSEGYYGGGNPMQDMDGNLVLSANLTFDETGIAKYTEEDFIKAVRFGKKLDGSMVKYPMVPHTTLTDLEVKGIYAYLKTIPIIKTGI